MRNESGASKVANRSFSVMFLVRLIPYFPSEFKRRIPGLRLQHAATEGEAEIALIVKWRMKER
jgi:hypothetical protein